MPHYLCSAAFGFQAIKLVTHLLQIIIDINFEIIVKVNYVYQATLTFKRLVIVLWKNMIMFLPIKITIPFQNKYEKKLFQTY